jgi:hypothetical protein
MNILSLLRALSHRNIRGGRRPGRTPIRKPSPYRPRIEALEDRSMLSSIQMLPLGDGTFQLRVDGDAKANQIAIVGQGPSSQTNDYSLLVTCDQLKQTVDHVSEVVIDTAGGADNVLLNGQWVFQGKGKTMPGVRSISVNTGGGDDEFKFIDFNGQSVNGIVPGPHIVIDTGSGDDLAWFRPIFHPPTLFAGLELSVRTGEGEDSVLVENLAFAASSADAPTRFGAVLPTPPNASRIGVDSGTGGDVVSLGNWSSSAAIIGPEVGLSGGGVSLSVETGAGRDKFLFHDNDLIAGSFDASVDLGSDDDTATFLGNTFGGPVQLTVNGGAENDRIEIGGADNDGDDYAGMMYENQFKSSLALVITGGSGDDLALLLCDGIAGSFDASVDLGSGNDTLIMEDNIFGGGLNLSAIGGVGGSASVTLDLGEGDDEAILEENYFFDVFHLQIGGGTGNDAIVCEHDWLSGLTDYDISLGSGDDTATFEGNYYDQGLNMTLDAGDGRDTAMIADNTYAGATLIGMLLGNGDDTAKMHGNQFGAGLALTIAGGSGHDFVLYSGNELAGALNAYIGLGNGNDTATFAGNTVNGVWKTTLNGGSGNDLVAVFNNIIAGSPEYFVDLGSGNDTATFAENMTTGSLLVTVLGGDGNDLVTVQYTSIGGVGGSVDVLVDLGDGNDTADVNLTLLNQDPAQHKPFTVRVLGGKGNDDLTLAVKADPEVLAAANLLIDGGSGFDHGKGGPFVKIVNCEQ